MYLKYKDSLKTFKAKIKRVPPQYAGDIETFNVECTKCCQPLTFNHLFRTDAMKEARLRGHTEWVCEENR